MVMGTMQVESIRRREEVTALCLPACSRVERQHKLTTAVPVPWCAYHLPPCPALRSAQARGALASVPETSTAAAPDASRAHSSPASVRAAADSPAASQAMIPLTVAQRAKAAAAALGTHCVCYWPAPRHTTPCDSDIAVHVLCRWRQSTKESAGARYLAGRIKGQEGAIRGRWPARGSKSGVCRCKVFLPHTTHIDGRCVCM